MISGFKNSNLSNERPEKEKPETKKNTLQNSDINRLLGSWRFDRNSTGYNISIDYTKNNFTATIQLIFANNYLLTDIIKTADINTFYLRYNSQDVSPHIATEYIIDEKKIDKQKNIAKIVYENGKIMFTWYGLFNIKTNKWIKLKGTPFFRNVASKPFTLTMREIKNN